tara:strand:+ start:253 stop:510 length:258 start_codon:yes stop_codon:yes gene_type:complete
MITNIEQLLQDYASYSFMEGTIDENTMNHLIEDAQNYVAKLNELKLLSLHNVVGQSEHCKHNQEDLIRNNSAGWKCKCGKEVTYF